MSKSGWSEYRPSKAMWAWSCIGCIVATMIIGFTWGGWVTGGTAEERAEAAAEEARTEVASAVCINKFVRSANAAQQFTALKKADSWERDGLIEEGGWSKINGYDGDLSEVAEECADQLASMEALPTVPSTTTAAEAEDI